MVAPAGAGPCPQITSTLSLLLRASCTITGTSPPGPLRCGSTTCSVNAVAHAASNALPPRSRMPIPTAVAIQCVEVTTPKVPSISGRVVNGFGLTKFIRVPNGSAAEKDGGLDHRSQAVPTPLRAPCPARDHMRLINPRARGARLRENSPRSEEHTSEL